MADGPPIGSAYLRVAGDFSQVRAQAVGLFRSSEWGKLGKVAGAGLAGGLIAGGALKALYDIGSAFDEVSDNIRTKTGATGKELGKLKKSFEGVVTNVPTDFKSASDAVAGLNQRLGLTGKPLTELSKQITQLSKITSTDVQENVESISRLFGDWSIKTRDQKDTLDSLFRVTQKTGIQLSDLSRLMVQFGSPLRQLGLGFETSAAMFSQFEQQGVNIQTLMPGLRFALKTFSGAVPATTDALKKLGVSLKDPQVALQDVFQLLKDAPTDMKANAIAFQVFGQRAGPDMAAAVREGRFELDDLIKTMQDGQGTIGQSERSTRDFSEQWTLFKNNLEVVVAPAAKKVFDFFGDSMKSITDIVRDKDLDWGEKWDALVDLAMEALGNLVDKAAELAPKVAGALVHGFLNAPVLAQLAVGGWLFSKLGGGSALKSLGQRLAGMIFGQGRGGAIGTLTGNLKPIPVIVVNKGWGGGPGSPTGGPGGKPTGTPTTPPPGEGGRPPWWLGGGAAGEVGLGLSSVAGASAITLVGGGLIGQIADRILGTGGGAIGKAKLQLTTLRQEVQNLAEAEKAVPLNLILRAGLDPEKLRKAGVEITGIRHAVGGLTKAIAPTMASGFGIGKALETDGKLSKHELDLISYHLESLPPDARKAAADSMVGFAAELESKGKLPEGSAKKLRKTLTDEFHGLRIDSVRQIDLLSKYGLDGLEELRANGIRSTRQLKEGISSNVTSLSRAVERGFSGIALNTNKILSSFGVQKLTFDLAGTIGKGAEQHYSGGKINAPTAIVGEEAPNHPEYVIATNPAYRDRNLALWADAGRMIGVPGFAKGGRKSGGMGAMIAEADRFEAHHFPYVLGGGHGSFGVQPVDCSGFVSDVLHAAGLLNVPMVSGALMNWGQPGKGPLTVYANAGHTFMSLDGRYAGTSGSNPGGGAGWIEGGFDSGYLSGFTACTMNVAGATAELARQILKGPDGPLKSLGQAALDKSYHAARGYIDRHRPAGSFGGGDASVDVPPGALALPELGRLVHGHGGPPILSYVGWNESGGDPRADNGTYKGLFQEGAPFWANYGSGPYLPNVFDPNATTSTAVAGYNAEGLSPWEASRNAGAHGGWGQNLGDGWPFQKLAQGGIVGDIRDTQTQIRSIKARLAGDKLTSKERARIGELKDLLDKKHLPADRRQSLRTELEGLQAQAGQLEPGQRQDLQHRESQLEKKLAGLRDKLAKRRAERAHHIAQAGLSPELRKKLHHADDQIAAFTESIDRIQTLAGLETSESGTDIGPGETAYLLSLYGDGGAIGLLDWHVRRRDIGKRQVDAATSRLAEIDTLLADEKTPKWKKAALRENRGNIKQLRRDAHRVVLDEEGISGNAGFIFDTQMDIAALGGSAAVAESNAMSIGDLVEFAKVVRYGAFDRVPYGFAGGGVVPGPVGAPTAAVVHGQETIRTPEQEAALGGGPMTLSGKIRIDNWDEGTGHFEGIVRKRDHDDHEYFRAGPG